MATHQDYANVFARQIELLKKSNPKELSKILTHIMGRKVSSTTMTPNQIALAVLVSGDKSAMGALYYIMAQNNYSNFVTPLDELTDAELVGTAPDTTTTTDTNTSTGGTGWFNQLWTGITASIPKMVDIYGRHIDKKNGSGNDGQSPNTPDIIINAPDNKISTLGWVGIVGSAVLVIGGFVYLATRKK